MKRKYSEPESHKIVLEAEDCILKGSVSPQVLVQKDFNIYTDDYEEKKINWDSVTFE